MPPNGTKNLIPTSERTKEEAKELGRLGGIASGKVRQEKARRKGTIKDILAMKIDENALPEHLRGLDLEFEREIIADLKLISQAEKGNLQAIKYVKELIGSDPYLELRKKEVEAKVKQQEADTKLLEQMKSLFAGNDSNNFDGLGDEDYERKDDIQPETTEIP